jgi:hypothetical protein
MVDLYVNTYKACPSAQLLHLKVRQPLVDQFKGRPSIFLFLMSTLAGGVGINLTAANKVVSRFRTDLVLRESAEKCLRRKLVWFLHPWLICICAKQKGCLNAQLLHLKARQPLVQRPAQHLPVPDEHCGRRCASTSPQLTKWLVETCLPC